MLELKSKLSLADEHLRWWTSGKLENGVAEGITKLN